MSYCFDPFTAAIIKKKNLRAPYIIFKFDKLEYPNRKSSIYRKYIVSGLNRLEIDV